MLSIFKTFCNEIKNQFGMQVHTLRTDNGKEFLSSSFLHFMSDIEISHQISYSYTPQQNGVVERKNHHLLEVARTFLINMNVPKHFWGMQSHVLYSS